MPFLSGTCARCRIGRALFVGKFYLADKAVININVLSACAVLVIAALMDNDFFNKLPQQGVGQFLKAGVLADNFHKLFRINRGFLCLCQFRLQFSGTALDLFLFGFIVCGKFRKAFIRNTPSHTVLIKPLEDSGQLRNPLFGCVPWVKGNDIVVAFHIFSFLVFAVSEICPHTGNGKIFLGHAYLDNTASVWRIVSLSYGYQLLSLTAVLRAIF